jgi:hypothetical protein
MGLEHREVAAHVADVLNGSNGRHIEVVEIGPEDVSKTRFSTLGCGHHPCEGEV